MHIKKPQNIPLPKTNFPLGGTILEGYGPVLKAFIKNFEEHSEVGASFSAYHKGQKVIDLWGGYSNKEAEIPWDENTLTVVFSATKGIAALCLLMLSERDQLDYDQLVAHYWPEFAQNGKDNISVRQLLTHTSGLCGIDTKGFKPFHLKRLASDEGKQKIKEALETQAPLFDPGTDQGYNAITFGMYAAELFKQASGEDMVDFYRREIQAPLNVEFWVGNADSQSHNIAKLYQISKSKRVIKMLGALVRGGSAEANLMRALMKPNALPKKAFFNPTTGARGALAYGGHLVQSQAFWWAGGFSNARGLAKMYAPLANKGSHGNVRLLKPSTVESLHKITSWSDQDRVLGKPLGWNQGFLKEEPHVFGRNPESFGHSGLGGAVGWADPVEELSFGYTMNSLDYRIRSPRCMRLCKALYESEALYR